MNQGGIKIISKTCEITQASYFGDLVSGMETRENVEQITDAGICVDITVPTKLFWHPVWGNLPLLIHAPIALSSSSSIT